MNRVLDIVNNDLMRRIYYITKNFGTKNLWIAFITLFILNLRASLIKSNEIHMNNQMNAMYREMCIYRCNNITP